MYGCKRVSFFLGILVLSLFLVTLVKTKENSSPNHKRTIKELSNLNDINEALYTQTSPIIINDDDDFLSYGFPGNGSSVSPFIIENFNITSDSSDLISISHVNHTYYIIRNNFLSGISKTRDGIVISDNKNRVNITGNIIFDVNIGVKIDSPEVVLYLTKNKIFNTSSHGVTTTDGHLIANNNEFISNGGTGISAIFFAFTDIQNNYISNSGMSSIIIGDASGGITNNTIINSGNHGIDISASVGSARRNRIINCTNHGVYLGSSTYSSYIENNIIAKNHGFGIYIDGYADNNHIINNTFIENVGIISQGFDAGNNNEIDFNYWSDHISPDMNHD